MRARFAWLLSVGHSDALSERQSRNLRVANAFALLGLVLSFLSLPMDLFGAPIAVALADVGAILAFAGCLLLAARGHTVAARVLLLATANGAMFAGVVALGAFDELRTVFFPLAFLPFLLFGVEHRVLLATFVALPIACYFGAASLEHVPEPGLALQVNVYYAPILAFTMIVGGALVVAIVDRDREATLLRARERSTQNARLAALGEMASGVAHEIRNPLAAIHLAAGQIVERRDDPATVQQFAERIQRIVMRGSKIIETLRSFSRDASGDPFVTTPVARILSDTLELCGKRFADQGIALAVDAVSAELAVDCRPMQIAQVLVNLLSNAHDAVATSPPGRERWVRVEVRCADDELSIAVVDSGPGVAADARARLFEPFFTTKSPDRGTGLGLSLSRGLAEAHGGTLTLEPAEHTRFVLRLPRVQPLQ